MLRSSFVGGKRGRVWAEVVASLNNSLKQARESKRNAPGTEVLVTSTETLGLLSRVLRMVVESAVGVDDANDAAADVVASLTEWNVPIEGKEKKRKTVSIDDIELAALVRLSKMVSRLAFAAGMEVKDNLAHIVGMLETSSGEATLELVRAHGVRADSRPSGWCRSCQRKVSARTINPLHLVLWMQSLRRSKHRPHLGMGARQQRQVARLWPCGPF